LENLPFSRRVNEAAILNGPQELGTLDAKIGAGSGDGDEIVSGSEKLE
jgi:hypothetical protein